MPRTGENIYKRKDGRWEGRYIQGRKADGSIRYGYLYQKSYSELRKQLFTYKILYKEEYFHYGKQTVGRMSFEKWALTWLTLQEGKVRPNTYQSYRSKLENHLVPLFGARFLTQLTTKELQEGILQLTEKLAPSSVRAIVRVLRTCLNQAVRSGFLFTSPAKDLSLPELPATAPKAFTKEEQKRIESCIEQLPKENSRYLPIYLALYTGLRIGEVAGIQWQDINWKEGTLTVSRNIQRVLDGKGQSRLIAANVKTKASHRVIPLSRSLHKWLNSQNHTKSTFIFAGRNNGPLDPRSLRYRWTQLKKIVQINDLPFHALRHTFATRCIEAGVPVTTISALLGHHSIKMTLDTYTNSFLSEKRLAINRLEV